MADHEHSNESPPSKLAAKWRPTWPPPYRFRIFVMLFLATTTHNTIRASFNIALVAMVSDNMTAEENVTIVDPCPGASWTINKTHEYHGEFLWDATQQSHLLSAFYYGYIVLQVPGGYLGERFGAKLVLAIASVLAGLFTVLIPVLAKTSFSAVLAVRILIGLVSGPVYTALMCLASQWAPKFEITTVVGATQCGNAIGTIIAFAFSGLLIKSGFLGGWPSVFYVFGTVLLLWSIVWIIIGADNPAKARGIPNHEREFIENNTENRDEVKYENPPWLRILTSPPVLVQWLIATTDGFGYYVMYTSLAFYMKQMLSYEISEDGLVMALLYASTFLAVALLCPLADFLRAKGYLSTRATRAIASCIGDYGLAAALLVVALAFECDRVAVVTLLILGQWLYGAVAAGFVVNPIDIAPVYAGTISGVGNTLGNTMGFTAPLVVGAIVGDQPSRAAWSRVFIITSAILFGGATLYAIFCKGDELEWAKGKRQTSPTTLHNSPSDIQMAESDHEGSQEVRKEGSLDA